MKKLIFICAFITSSVCFAETSYFVQLTSDWVSRGISQNNHQAALQASIEEVNLVPNLLAGLWASNIYDGTRGETEVDLYTTYGIGLNSEFKLNLSAFFYYFTRNQNFNTWDYQVTLENPYLNFVISYRPDSFGAKTSNTYFEISKSILINEAKKLSLKLNLGYSDFDKEENVGTTNYLNYRVAAVKSSDFFDLTFFYTNTDRKLLSAGEKTDIEEQVFGVSVSKVF